MSGSISGFTAAEVVQVRRWCGYPPLSRLRGGTDALSQAMATLSAEEVADARAVYLVPLATLEAAVPATGAGLDVASVIGFTRNPAEVAEREGLLRSWKLRLCAFLGVDSGPYSSLMIPGAFVV